MRSFIIGLLGLLAFVLLSHTARAQATLDTNTKIQIVKLVVDQAEKAMAEGKRDTARFYLLGITEVASKLRTKLPEDVAAKFNKVATAAWPDMQENVADFEKTVKDFTPKLNKYGGLMNFMQPHDTMGFDEWARFVIGARAINADAEACATAYADKAPPPAIHLTNAGVNLGAYALFPSLFNVLLGETFANDYAKNDILPNALKKGSEVLDGVSPTEKSPDTLMFVATQIQTYASYAQSIEKDNADAKTLQEKSNALIDKANKLYAAQVKANRMPGDSYKGEKGDDLREQMKSLYEKQFKGETVLTIQITSSNWVEFAEAWSDVDTIKSGVFRSIDAAVAVQREDKHYWVYHVRFRRQWTGVGDTFGDIYLSGALSTCYEILKENIK